MTREEVNIQKYAAVPKITLIRRSPFVVSENGDRVDSLAAG